MIYGTYTTLFLMGYNLPHITPYECCFLGRIGRKAARGEL
jgi:hypothetical protein